MTNPRSTKVLQRSAPAKINLGLHVLRKRPDGYHDIETVFVRIPWADVLTAEVADGLRLECSDPALPVDQTNLVLRAARALANDLVPMGGGSRQAGAASDSEGARDLPGARLYLEKHLPFGGGLGGGSSDAAAALLLLNELWSLKLTRRALREIAATVGSDVPFFLGAETAIGTGRGERLEPLIDPSTDEPYRPPYALVVAVPPEHISTPQAYALVTPRAANRPDLRDAVLSNDLERWRRELVNDFEAPIFDKYPAVAAVKEALVSGGAGYTSLSGSGAAVYGFFEEDDEAAGTAEALRESGHKVWHGRV